MGISFIHLSDIHFCKSSGTSIDIDADLRNAVLTDIKYNVKENLQDVTGILVGGDVAFSAQNNQYKQAKEFLKELTDCLGINEKNIYCVPGNHDVNQAIIKESTVIQNVQSEIENAGTLDVADNMLEKYLSDPVIPNLLFNPLEEYNNFAALYGCNINGEKPVWTGEFSLNYGMRLKLRGMNSCVISSHKDHTYDSVRKMIVGQYQLPKYEDNVTWVSICHHPVDFWEFFDEIQPRLDKRIDIQLYGHMHQQAIDASPERLVINAGATQPTRGNDWSPRYNWISFECEKIGRDRWIKVKVFPRVLSKDRDRFECDYENCSENTNHFLYTLNVDEKRRKNLQDNARHVEPTSVKEIDSQRIPQGIAKEIVYNFFQLSYIHQTEVLTELELFRNEYAGQRYVNLIETIIEDAKVQNCLERMDLLIKQKL